MPDSLPPIQGPASYAERDLDSLLSGEAGYPVVAPGPVAGVLAALRGAPAPDELDGEAAARAAFRLFVLPDGGSPAGLPQAMRPGGPRHRRVRHRRARRPVPWPGGWQVMAIAGSAAAAVIVGTAALAGAFSGPGGHQGSAVRQATAQAAGASSGHATSPVLEGGGHSVPRATPQPTGTSPEGLCRNYFDFYAHPQSPANWSKERTVIQQLSKLADGILRINAYCAGRLGTGSRSGPDHQGGGGDPGSGDQQVQGRFAEPDMPRFGRG